MPKAPKSPEEASLINQMQEYENASVDVEGQAPAGESQNQSQQPVGDYFEELKVIDEEDQRRAEAAH